MTGLVTIFIQMGLVIGGFVGAEKILDWYNKEGGSDSKPFRGGVRRSKRDDEGFFG